MPDVYVIDTSAWLDIDTRPDFEGAWKIIEALIKQGRIVAPAQVLAELHDNPIYLTRLKPYESALLAGDEKTDDPDYLIHVGRITFDHPGMSRATGRKTPADPYVIALAEREQYVVVANESLRNRPNRKIPGVCRQRRIRCITLDQFVSDNADAEAAAAGMAQ